MGQDIGRNAYLVTVIKLIKLHFNELEHINIYLYMWMCEYIYQYQYVY